jgi:hypothetical protein
MKWIRHTYVLRFALVLSLAAFLGCSKFRSQRRVNLKPFAEDMIAIAGDIQYGLGQVHVVYLRGYTETPEMEHLDLMALKVRRVIRGTIAYAIEVVTLAESKQPEKTKAAGLAEYLDGLLRPVLSQPRPPLNITISELDTIIDDVARQKKFLDALGAAQPIIDEVARVSGEVFEDTKNALDATILSVQDRIDEDIKPVVEADRLLRNAQIQTTFNLRYLQSYRTGNKAALDSLMNNEPSLREFDSPTGEPTLEFMQSIEARLLAKLEAIRAVRDQLRPDVELYWKQQEELEKITASYNAALRQARVAVLAWARAHARLAAGITDPAEINVLGIARKAAGSVAPIP